MNCIPCGQNLNFVASALAAALTENLNATESNILGAFVTILGDSIALIAATKSVCEDSQTASQSSDTAG